MQSAYYEESNQITPGRLAAGLAVSLATAVFLGYIYGNLVYISPFVYINAVVCFFFGAILGYVANYAGRIAHLRSLKWRIGFGLFTGLVAYFSQWCSYVPAVYADQLTGPADFATTFTYFVNPLNLLEELGTLNSLGVWQIFGIPNSGVFGIVVWLVELGLIVAVPVVATYNAKVHPYSERMGRFYEAFEVPDGYGGSISSPSAFVKEVRENGFEPFTRLTAPRSNLCYVFQLYYLEGEQRHYLDISRVSTTTRDGKVKEEVNLVVDNLAIDTETARRIKTELKAERTKLTVF